MSTLDRKPAASGPDLPDEPEQPRCTWTALLAPRLDLLGPGSRITVVAAQGDYADAEKAYSSDHSAWVNVAEMRIRSHEEQADGHYWETIWADPRLDAETRFEMEGGMAGCQYKFQAPPALVEGEPGGLLSAATEGEGQRRSIKAYHGTNAEFTTFEKPEINRMADRSAVGFWFTISKGEAAGYGTRVITAELALENPRRVTRRELDMMAVSLPLPQLMAKLKRGGHDGLIVEGIKAEPVLDEPGMAEQYVVFEPAQIKVTSVEERPRPAAANTAPPARWRM